MHFCRPHTPFLANAIKNFHFLGELFPESNRSTTSTTLSQRLSPRRSAAAAPLLVNGLSSLSSITSQNISCTCHTRWKPGIWGNYKMQNNLPPELQASKQMFTLFVYPQSNSPSVFLGSSSVGTFSRWVVRRRWKVDVSICPLSKCQLLFINTFW